MTEKIKKRPGKKIKILALMLFFILSIFNLKISFNPEEGFNSISLSTLEVKALIPPGDIFCIDTGIFVSGTREVRGDAIWRDNPGPDIHEGYVQTCSGIGTGCQPQSLNSDQNGCYTLPQ